MKSKIKIILFAIFLATACSKSGGGSSGGGSSDVTVNSNGNGAGGGGSSSQITLLDIFMTTGGWQFTKATSMYSSKLDETFTANLDVTCDNNQKLSIVLSKNARTFNLQGNSCHLKLTQFTYYGIVYKAETAGSELLASIQNNVKVLENATAVAYTSVETTPKKLYANVTSYMNNQFIIGLTDNAGRYAANFFSFLYLEMSNTASTASPYVFDQSKLFVNSSDNPSIFPNGQSLAFTLPLSTPTENGDKFHGMTWGGNSLGTKFVVTLKAADNTLHQVILRGRSTPTGCPDYSMEGWTLSAAVSISCADSSNTSRGFKLYYYADDNKEHQLAPGVYSGQIFIQAVSWHSASYSKNILIKTTINVQ